MSAGSSKKNAAKLKAEIVIFFIFAAFFIFVGLFYLFRAYGDPIQNKIQAVFFLLAILGLVWGITRRVNLLYFSKDDSQTSEK